MSHSPFHTIRRREWVYALFYGEIVLQTCVKSSLFHERVMIARLQYPPVLHDKDGICIFDCLQTVGYDEACSPLHEVVEALLDMHLRHRIDTRCRLIQNQDVGVLENCLLYTSPSPRD